MQIKNRCVNLGAGVVRHYRKWYLAYICAAIVIVGFGSHYKIAVNMTNSLPGNVYLIVKGELPTFRGEPMAFTWRDPDHKTQYPDGITFLKLAAGLPGDLVTRNNDTLTINDWSVTPKIFSKRGLKLDKNTQTGIIPEGRYFVIGLHRDSLDSRYAMVGLIPQAEVIGRAYELF